MRMIVKCLVCVAAMSCVSLVWADDDLVRSLAVNGEARIKVPADWASFQVGVETVNEDADKALQDNTRKMVDVKKALLKAGVQESELSTSRFTVSPRWEPRPKLISSDWTPSIIGYQVSAYLKIETMNLNKIGDWIQVAVESGSGAVNGLRFDLQNPDEHRTQAIAKATEQAKVFAQSAADAAGVSLQELILVEVNGATATPISRPRMQEKMLMSAASAPSIPVDVDPGDIEVWAQVRLNYRIQ